jgi:hypothetical protein
MTTEPYRTALKSVLADIGRDYPTETVAAILKAEPSIIREAEAGLWRERYAVEMGEALAGYEQHIIDAFERGDLPMIGKLVADAMSRYVLAPLARSVKEAQDADAIERYVDGIDSCRDGYCE